MSQENKDERYAVTIAAWNKLAERYRDTFNGLQIYDETYNLFCDLIKTQNARVLEIGCGPGTITNHLAKRRPDFKITASDVSEEMITLAAKENPGVKFIKLDARELSELKEKFDAVMCGFMIPYLAPDDLKQMLQAAVKVLNPGGIAYFSLIEGPSEKSGWEMDSKREQRMFVNYYSEDEMAKYFSENNFTLIHAEKIPYTRANGISETHLIFIVKR